MTDVIVAFSGGRTSAFMCKWLIDNTSHFWKLHFFFANTGQEHEKTLEFVHKCDQYFGLNLTWLEAIVTPEKGKATGHKIVNYETAARKGEPFEEVINKYGVPNIDYPHCTRELKIRPRESWEKSIGLSNSKLLLGIRIDEPNRIKRDNRKIYPLVDLIPTTKEEILSWWKTQPFDLEIPEHLGNCTWCWKKSDRKLGTIAREEPDRFLFPMLMEAKYGGVHTEKEQKEIDRVFFRKYRNTFDILELANADFESFADANFETCAEECGSVFPDE